MELSYLFEAYCTRTYDGAHLEGKLHLKEYDLIFEYNETQIDTIPIPIIQGVSIYNESTESSNFVELRVLTIYGLAVYYGPSRALVNLHDIVQNAIRKYQQRSNNEDQNVHERNLLFVTCRGCSIYGGKIKNHSILLTSKHMYIFGFLRGPHFKIPLQNIRFTQIRGKLRKVYIGFYPSISSNPVKSTLSEKPMFSSSHKKTEEEETSFETYVFEGKEAIQLYAYLKVLIDDPESEVVMSFTSTVRCSSIMPNKIPYKAICVISDKHWLCVPLQPYHGILNYNIIKYTLIQVGRLTFSAQYLSVGFDDGCLLECLDGEYGFLKIKRLTTLINGHSHRDLYEYWDSKIPPVACSGWSRIEEHIETTIHREEQNQSSQRTSQKKMAKQTAETSTTTSNIIHFSSFNNLHKRQLLFFSATIWRPARDIQFGWIAVIGEKLIFYPRDINQDIRIVSKDSLYRNDDGDTSKHILALRIEEEHFQIQQKEMRSLQKKQQQKKYLSSKTMNPIDVEKSRIQKQLTKQEFWTVDNNIGSDLTEIFFSNLPIPHRRLLWRNWSIRHRRQVLHKSNCKLTKRNRFQNASQTQTCEGILCITNEGMQVQPIRGSLTNASLVDVEIASFNGRYRFQSTIYRIGEELTPEFFLHPPKYMELTSQRAVSRTLYTRKAVVLFLSYNEEQDNLIAMEYIHELEIRDISSKGIGLFGNIFIPDKQYILIDISSDIGTIQVQAKKTYHYETISNRKQQLKNPQTQFRYCYGFEFLFPNISTQRKVEELINHLNE